MKVIRYQARHTPRLNRRDVFGKLVERTAPAALMIIAGGNRLKRGLMQCQPGPSTQIHKRQSQQGLGARRPAVSVRPTIGPDNSLRRNDFMKDSLLPMVLTVGSTLVDTIVSALTQLPSENAAAEAFRADPSGEMLGLGPAFEDQFARRVEDALDDEHALR